jgi:toxin ParE1/3/4
MPTVKLSDQASADIDEIYTYIGENDPSAAERLTDELYEKFYMLSENPLSGRLRTEIGPGLRSFPHRRYIIIYITVDRGVEIYRVLHSARDVESQFEM